MDRHKYCFCNFFFRCSAIFQLFEPKLIVSWIIFTGFSLSLLRYLVLSFGFSVWSCIFRVLLTFYMVLTSFLFILKNIWLLCIHIRLFVFFSFAPIYPSLFRLLCAVISNRLTYFHRINCAKRMKAKVPYDWHHCVLALMLSNRI